METKDSNLLNVAGKAIPERPASPTKFKAAAFVNENIGKISESYDVINTDQKEGGFGVVKKVVHKASKEIRAMKIMSKKHLISQDEGEKFVADIEILRKLDHPNILRIHEFYQDDKNYYIIYEFCNGGELFDKIIESGSLSETDAASIMKQILSAVLFAHRQNIVHRDLKPENVLLDKVGEHRYVIKVIDWGAAKVMDPTQAIKEKIGSIYWVAPEVLKREYNEKCDVWSCGAILYAILSGCPPFDGKSDADIESKILKGKFTFKAKDFKGVSQEAKDVIKAMLTLDPKTRPSAEEILAYPWFSKFASAETHAETAEVLSQSLDNLKSFKAEQNIQKAAVTFIATQLMTKDERNKLIEAFKELDENGDGVLSRDEILKGYRKIMSEERAIQEVDLIMSKVDLDGSGQIDYSEFLAAAACKDNILSEPHLKEAFKMFDKDGSGSISVEELKKALGAVLTEFDESSWQEMLKEVDENGDGEISFEEFASMMRKYC